MNKLPESGKMRIRAKLLVRNDVLVQARKHLGMTQMDLSKATDVPINAVQAIESLKYNGRDICEYAKRLSEFLEVPVEQVLPKELAGKVLQATHESVAEIPVSRVLGWANSRFLLPSPESEADKNELKRRIDDVIKDLPEKQRFIITKRLGLDGKGTMTCKELSEVLGVCKQAVSQEEGKAIRKLQHSAGCLSPFLKTVNFKALDRIAAKKAQNKDSVTK